MTAQTTEHRGLSEPVNFLFKKREVKEFCNCENIKRTRCTQKLQKGTGQVERMIRTIRSLTKANLVDGLTLEESVQLAIKTMRQALHSKLNITNRIGQPACLLSN